MYGEVNSAIQPSSLYNDETESRSGSSDCGGDDKEVSTEDEAKLFDESEEPDEEDARSFGSSMYGEVSLFNQEDINVGVAPAEDDDGKVAKPDEETSICSSMCDATSVNSEELKVVEVPPNQPDPALIRNKKTTETERAIELSNHTFEKNSMSLQTELVKIQEQVAFPNETIKGSQNQAREQAMSKKEMNIEAWVTKATERNRDRAARLALAKERIRLHREERPRKDEGMNLEERKAKAFEWYHRCGYPCRDEFKAKIQKLNGACDITLNDIDLLDWTRNGKRVSG